MHQDLVTAKKTTHLEGSTMIVLSRGAGVTVFLATVCSSTKNNTNDGFIRNDNHVIFMSFSFSYIAKTYNIPDETSEH